MEFPSLKQISQCYIKPKYEVQESKQPYYLSPFDLVFLSIHYNQKGLLYAKPNQGTFNISQFLKTLKDSLAHTLVHFYPLAGQLDKLIDEDQHSMLVFIDCHKGPGARFVHAQLDTTISNITTSTYVPEVVKSFFDHQNGGEIVNYDSISRPLLSIQVTELVDGIFIGCTMNHLPADGMSFWHFWNTWSEIQRSIVNNIDNENEHIFSISRQPMHDRWVPNGYGSKDLLLPYTSPDEFIYRYKPPPIKERFFHFSSKTISKLKSKANQEINNTNNNTTTNNNNINISSFQALTALIWKSIIRAKGLKNPNQTTECHLIANNRTRLSPPLPPEYFGNALGVLISSTKVVDLLEQNLGQTALLLHKSVANHTEKNVQEFAISWLKSPFVYKFDKMFSLEANSSVQIGSSPRFDIYGNEFSEIGKPIAVRSGFANKFDGKVIVYPGCDGGGSVDVEVCFSCGCMNALECDEEFMAYVG